MDRPGRVPYRVLNGLCNEAFFKGLKGCSPGSFKGFWLFGLGLGPLVT